MGFIEKRMGPQKGTKWSDGEPRYRARWIDAAGKERSKTYRQKGRAEKHLKEVEGAILDGRWVQPGRTTTLATYARTWLDSRPHRANTRHAVNSCITVWVEGHPLGALPLTAITATACQSWATDLSRTRAETTSRKYVTTVRSILSAAVADGLIPRNPMPRRVKLSANATPKRKGQALTPATLAAISSALPARWSALVWVGAGTGLRPGELLGLPWSNVDLDGGTLTVTQQLDSRTLQPAPPKSKASRRTVPLAPVVVEALKTHAAEYPPADRAGYVFTGSTGAPLTRHNLNAGWRDAAKTVGVTGTVPHDLRHTYASVLLAAGVDVVTVAARLGHDDARITLAVYGHLVPQAVDRTADVVQAALAHRPSA